MDRRDAYILTRELRSLYKAVDDLARRQAAAHMTGKVAEIKGDKVRLELLEQGANGEPFLSPWVQVQESAGATGTHFPVRVGDPMRLFSPQGELGPASLAIRDSYTKDAPNPAEGQELVINHDGCVIRMEKGRITLESDELFHNEKNVGDTHLHTGVTPGGGLTGVPA